MVPEMVGTVAPAGCPHLGWENRDELVQIRACLAGRWTFNWSHSQVSEVVMGSVYLVRDKDGGMSVCYDIRRRTLAVRARAGRGPFEPGRVRATGALGTAATQEAEPC